MRSPTSVDLDYFYDFDSIFANPKQEKSFDLASEQYTRPYKETDYVEGILNPQTTMPEMFDVDEPENAAMIDDKGLIAYPDINDTTTAELLKLIKETYA